MKQIVDSFRKYKSKDLVCDMNAYVMPIGSAYQVESTDDIKRENDVLRKRKEDFEELEGMGMVDHRILAGVAEYRLTTKGKEYIKEQITIQPEYIEPDEELISRFMGIVKAACYRMPLDKFAFPLFEGDDDKIKKLKRLEGLGILFRNNKETFLGREITWMKLTENGKELAQRYIEKK
jgi:hypothetical protein